LPPPPVKGTLQQRFNAMTAKAPTAPDGGAQSRFRGEVNAMVRELAAAGETHALVRVWDSMGGAAAADGETWAVLQRLHSQGKGRIPRGSLVVVAVPAGKRELEPQRRLHKICKGAVTTRRSDAANAHLAAACAFLEARRAAQPFSKRDLERSSLAKTLRAALGVNKDTARGLVTKLKQTKRCKELLFRAPVAVDL